MAQIMRKLADDQDAIETVPGDAPLPNPLAHARNAGPHCPACGFRIFNRRYPRCESCGSELPETIVYSPAERFALIAADEEAAREIDRRARPQNDSVFGAIDDPLLDVLISSTGR